MKKILTKGDCIGIVSPSAYVPKNGLEIVTKYFEDKGFKVKLSKNVFKEERFIAGTDAERSSDLMEMFTDPEIKLILVSRGGYGSTRLLDKLDYDIIKKNPKPLVGFSDTTGLQMGLLAQANLPSLTGMMGFIDFETGKLDPIIEESFWNLINGKPVKTNNFDVLRHGKTEGILIGGCLALISDIVGTKYLPSFKDAILLIEEVREEPYRVDRKLTQLRLAGILDQVSAIIWGEFKDCTAKNKRDGTIEQVVDEFSSYVNCPVIKNFHYGHGDSRLVLPIGGKIKLDTKDSVYCEI